MNKAILIATFICFRADAFDTAQLPPSDDIAETFPEISSSCYIIANEDTNVVVTSSNSEIPIDTGTFSEMYDVAQLATLHEMAKQFTDTKQFFQSAMSGNGCAIRYKNKNGTRFIILLYGEPTKEATSNDIEKIKVWLEQFYIYNVQQQDGHLLIPIIYGTRSFVSFKTPETQPILLSSKRAKKNRKSVSVSNDVESPNCT